MHQDMIEHVMDTFIKQHSDKSSRATHLLATVYYPETALNADPGYEKVEHERAGRTMANRLVGEWHRIAANMRWKRDDKTLRARDMYEFSKPNARGIDVVVKECKQNEALISEIALDMDSQAAVNSLMDMANCGRRALLNNPKDYYLVILVWDTKTLRCLNRVGQNLYDYTQEVLARTKET